MKSALTSDQPAVVLAEVGAGVLGCDQPTHDHARAPCCDCPTRADRSDCLPARRERDEGAGVDAERGAHVAVRRVGRQPDDAGRPSR